MILPNQDVQPSALGDYQDKIVSAHWSPKSKMLVLESDRSGQADLLVWSPQRVELLKRGTDVVKNSGLSGLKDIRSIVAGDFDNDNLVDLCVITSSEVIIFP